MLTYERLAALEAEAGDMPVLSAYLGGGQGDPAAKHVWRTEVRNQIAAIERELDGGTRQERADLDQALDRLNAQLAEIEGQPPDPGWIAFITPQQVLYSERVPVHVQTKVRWGPGLLATPYLRALKQQRLIVVALTDQREVRLLRYAERRLEEWERVGALTPGPESTGDSMSKRATGSSGVRGDTGTDRADRTQRTGQQRLHKRVAARLIEAAGDQGRVAIGGTPEAADDLLEALQGQLAGRTISLSGVHIDDSPAIIERAVRQAARRARADEQQQEVRRVVDEARGGGRGALGSEEVETALSQQRVETLLISRTFWQADLESANRAVRLALRQGAAMEEISGRAADMLDEAGRGIGARLRYVIPSTGTI